MILQQMILLLGRRDQPTDGVADYCEKLREAGAARGLSIEIAAVRWAERGWRDAAQELRKAAASWRNRWVLLQYTTLAWSRRGFPLRVPRLLDVLRQCGARPAVVFHDFMPVLGSGTVAAVRGYCQLHVLRELYARSSLSIFTVPLDKIGWLPPSPGRSVFIPVGSNFPELDCRAKGIEPPRPAIATVAVFGVTGGSTGFEEVGDITHTVKGVQAKGLRLRLVLLGRGAQVFEEELRQGLNGSGVEFSMLGLMPAKALAEALAEARVLLCVRGHVSSRRGSAIAGIVCGVPIVGYRGEETAFPMTEAGVRLVNRGDREGLVESLAHVLSDDNLYQDLRRRNLAAARKYFSWDAIASQFASATLGQ